MHHKPINLTFVQIKNRFSTRGGEQRSNTWLHCISSNTRKTNGIVFSYRPIKHIEKDSYQCWMQDYENPSDTRFGENILKYWNTNKKDAFVILFYIHGYSYDLLFLWAGSSTALEWKKRYTGICIPLPTSGKVIRNYKNNCSEELTNLVFHVWDLITDF